MGDVHVFAGLVGVLNGGDFAAGFGLVGLFEVADERFIVGHGHQRHRHGLFVAPPATGFSGLFFLFLFLLGRELLGLFALGVLFIFFALFRKEHGHCGVAGFIHAFGDVALFQQRRERVLEIGVHLVQAEGLGHLGDLGVHSVEALDLEDRKSIRRNLIEHLGMDPGAQHR